MRIGLGVSLLLATFTLGAWAAPARADVIDPAEEACGAEGDECTVDGKAGLCKKETCSKLDYSNMGPDGTPGTREYDCVRCIPGAKKPASPDAASDAKAGAKAEPEPQSTSKGTSCSVQPTTTSVVSVMLGLGLLGLAVRRRPG